MEAQQRTYYMIIIAESFTEVCMIVIADISILYHIWRLTEIKLTSHQPWNCIENVCKLSSHQYLIVMYGFNKDRSCCLLCVAPVIFCSPWKPRPACLGFSSGRQLSVASVRSWVSSKQVVAGKKRKILSKVISILQYFAEKRFKTL